MNASISCNPSTESLHAKFLTIAPRVELHAKIYFRGEKCPHTKADRIAETVATAWKWFVHLAAKGKDATAFPMALASLAARAVKCGRKIAGMNRGKDVMIELTQQRRGFTVEPLPIATRTSYENLHGAVHGQRKQDEYEERLRDNTVTPPPDQAAFRIDWPMFLKTLTGRDRKLAKFLSMGHSNKMAARHFHLSEGRLSQLRKQWRREWRISQGDAVFISRRAVRRKPKVQA